MRKVEGAAIAKDPSTKRLHRKRLIIPFCSSTDARIIFGVVDLMQIKFLITDIILQLFLIPSLPTREHSPKESRAYT